MVARSAARISATPVGAIVAAVLAAGVVALRVASGKPLEGMGAEVNRMLLGDADEKSRAWNLTRQGLQSDPNLSRIVAQEGGVNAQVEAIAKGMAEFHEREQKGISLLTEEFPVNNMLDMLIVRAASAFRSAWGSGGGEQSVERLRVQMMETAVQPNHYKGDFR
jgi:hypothetical protein